MKDKTKFFICLIAFLFLRIIEIITQISLGGWMGLSLIGAGYYSGRLSKMEKVKE